MGDKDILQLEFKDLNHGISPLKNTPHHISSETASSSNKHELYVGCLLPRHFFSDILRLEIGLTGFPETS
jgi:hypothetical protein